MALTKESIDNRLKEIPQQIAALSAEQNQLLGYKQAQKMILQMLQLQEDFDDLCMTQYVVV